MAKKKKKDSKRVGYPLSPDILGKIGELNDFTPAFDKFKPEGSWENKYRIWVCHGYIKSSNKNCGMLRVIKTAGNSPGFFSLTIRQEIVHYEGIVLRTDVDLKCINDYLATPIEWELSNRFFGPDKKEKPELDSNVKGIIGNDTIEIKSINHSFKHKIINKTTSDFCLFEAIQRRALKKEQSEQFDILEGMSLLKENHYLVYRGLETFKINNKQTELHHFHQIGQGVLPYNYWLDSNHRLVLVQTGSRVYILDEDADKKVKEYEKKMRITYNRNRRRYDEEK